MQSYNQIDSGKEFFHIDNINLLVKQTLTHVITDVFTLQPTWIAIEHAIKIDFILYF